MRRFYILLTLLMFTIASISSFLIVNDFNNYRDVLVTERDFDACVENLTFNFEQEDIDNTSSENIYTNLTIKFRNKGRTKVSLYDVSFHFILEDVDRDETHYISNFAQNMSNIVDDNVIEPGETLTYRYCVKPQLDQNKWNSYFDNEDDYYWGISDLKVSFGYTEHERVPNSLVYLGSHHIEPNEVSIQKGDNSV